MRRAIFLQVAAVLIAAAAAAVFIGMRSATSVLLGGAAYALPSIWFAARLSAAAAKGKAQAAGFFVGELLKIAGTVALLAAAGLIIGDVHWPSLLIGLFLALKANLLAFLLKT